AGLRAYVDGTWRAPVAPEALPSPVITSLLADDDRLWIGTTEGVALYDLAGSVRVEAATLGISAEALTLDDQGNLWVGTRDDGIWQRRLDGQWRQFRYDPNDPNSLPGNSVPLHGLSIDPNVAGGVW